MAFSDGDFIMVEYTATRIADNSIIYTTDKKLAEEKGIADSKGVYGPVLVVIGKSSIIKGLDKVLREMSIGEEKSVDLEPADAFGERDDSLLRVMSLADFRRQDITPYPGMLFDIDGTTATVRSINSGRVLVDLNNPLAGERINYKVKIIKKIEDEKEKVEAIIESESIKASSVEAKDGNVRIVFDDSVKKDANFLVRKSAAVGRIFEYMGVKKVEVEEQYTKEKWEEERKQEQPEQNA